MGYGAGQNSARGYHASPDAWLLFLGALKELSVNNASPCPIAFFDEAPFVLPQTLKMRLLTRLLDHITLNTRDPVRRRRGYEVVAGLFTKETRARADKTVRQRNDNKRGQCLQRPLMSDVKTPVVAPGVIGKHEKREAEIDIAACGTYGLHIQCSSFANGIGVAAEKGASANTGCRGL